MQEIELPLETTLECYNPVTGHKNKIQPKDTIKGQLKIFENPFTDTNYYKYIVLHDKYAKDKEDKLYKIYKSAYNWCVSGKLPKQRIRENSKNDWEENFGLIWSTEYLPSKRLSTDWEKKNKRYWLEDCDTYVDSETQKALLKGKEYKLENTTLVPQAESSTDDSLDAVFLDCERAQTPQAQGIRVPDRLDKDNNESSNERHDQIQRSTGGHRGDNQSRSCARGSSR